MIGGLGLVIMVFLTFHVDPAVEVAVSLVDHRRADCLLRIGERHGKRVVPLHDLRQARPIGPTEKKRDQNHGSQR